MVDATSAIIGAGSVAGLLVLLAIGKFIQIGIVGIKPAYPEGGPTTTIFREYSIINFIRILYYFLPYSLFLFGVIYDGLSRQIQFFPAGFVGLIAALINYVLSKLIGNSTVDTDICGIPGMSLMGSDVAPQNITFTTAILSYIAAHITRSKQYSVQYTGVAWGGVFIAWVIQFIMFNVNNCNTSKSTGWLFTNENEFLKRIVPPVLGLFSGLLWGGLSGALISKYIDSGPGLQPDSSGLLGSKSGGPAMAPTSGTPGVGTCSSTDSDDQFVCEAYKNGELVTSTIVE